MHKVTARFLALLMALVMLAGCGTSSKPAETPKETKPAAPAEQKPSGPVKGGTFSMPLNSNPAMWPVAGGLPNIIANKAIFSTLVKYDDPTLKPVGDLAESWEVSKDGLVWTFKLRKGVKWHDGKPFTADDVLFTINDIWLNKKITWFLRSNFATLTKAEKVDDHTVKLVTSSPTGNLPTMLGYLAQILPKHILGNWTPEQFAKPADFTKNPIGTGPFKFKEFVPGSHLKLQAFDGYFLGRPHLDELIFKVIADTDQQLAQLKSGQLDFVPIEPYQLKTVQSDANLRVTEAKQVNYFYVAFHNKMEPFTDKRVRQALSYAVDTKAIIQNTLEGKGRQANSPISPLLGDFHNKDARFYNFDKAKAEALLDEAGWKKGAGGIRQKDGKPLKVVLEVDAGNATREQTAVIVQDYWKSIGVDATIKTSDFNALLKRVRSGAKADVQAYIMWYITAPDPDVWSTWGCGQSTNTFHYCNPKVDELLKKGRATADVAERAKLYKEAQALIADDAAILFLYYPHELHAVSKKVQNWPSLGFRDAFTHITKVWKQK